MQYYVNVLGSNFGVKCFTCIKHCNKYIKTIYILKVILVLCSLLSCPSVDESSGTSRDWAAGVAKIPYVYTLELRDTGTYAFMLPPNQIIPTGVETWAGIQAMAAHVLDNDPDDGRQGVKL